MENNQKIVRFDQWCPRCKYRKYAEAEPPCHECLNEPVNLNSCKPTNFVPRVGAKVKVR